MKENEVLAYFLEHLWSKGFKLSDEEVQFIYFGKKIHQYFRTSCQVSDLLDFTAAVIVRQKLLYQFIGIVPEE